MTPAVIDNPRFSSVPKSSDGMFDLWECREDRDPFALEVPLGTCKIDPASS